MKSVKLSEMERARGGRSSREVEETWEEGVEPQVIAKPISNKSVHVEALANALARVWSPLKGLDCKNMGENIFLFTFRHPKGKRKALENGPWEFGKALPMVENFVSSKTLCENTTIDQNRDEPSSLTDAWPDITDEGQHWPPSPKALVI